MWKDKSEKPELDRTIVCMTSNMNKDYKEELKE